MEAWSLTLHMEAVIAEVLRRNQPTLQNSEKVPKTPYYRSQRASRSKVGGLAGLALSIHRMDGLYVSPTVTHRR